MVKITLWTLEDEANEPKWFGKVAWGEAITYAALQSILEENETLDSAFGFWDVEDKRCMRKQLEWLNNIFSNIYIIHMEGGGAKYNMCVIDGSHDIDFVEAIATKVV